MSVPAGRFYCPRSQHPVSHPMKTISRFLRPGLHAALALTALLVLSACGTMNTIEARTKEKAAVFAAATKWEQKTMREGWIDYGFTPDMVYIALDKPDKIVVTADGGNEIWIYNNFDQQNTAFGGGVKVSVQAGSALGGQGMSPTSQAARQSYQSAGVSPDLGAANVEPVSRLYVVFLHGKVNHVDLKKE